MTMNDNEVVKVYANNTSTNSLKNTTDWFDAHGIDYELITFGEKENLKEEVIISCILNSFTGLDSIVTRNTNQIDDMTVSQAIIWLSRHPKHIKSPIVIQNHKIMIGFNIEEIRSFLPKSYKVLSRYKAG